MKNYQECKEAGKYNPEWGEKAVLQTWHRTDTDVWISRQGYKNGYCNCIPYVQKLCRCIKEILKKQIKLLVMKTKKPEGKYTQWVYWDLRPGKL